MLSFVYSVPLIVILLPMLAAVFIPVFNKGYASRNIATAVLIIAVAATALLTLQMAAAPFDFTFSMGKFPAPFGNELRAGAVESLTALVFSLVALLSIWGGQQEAQEDIPQERIAYYYMMLCLIFSSLMALVFTNDFFTAYVFMEINAVAACAIVVAKENGKTLVAGLKYLVMSIIGSSMFLLGVSMLYGITGHLLMEPALKVMTQYAKTGEYHLPIVVILGLFFVGIGIKSALLPFHTWLPDAHGSATSTSSAILSGLVLKGYIVLIIKLILRVFGLDLINQLGVLPVLAVLGLIAMIAASVLAIRQTDIKRRIAYSTVAQIGYIYVGLSMGTLGGYSTAMYHLLAHAATKSMLFIAVGSLIKTSGSYLIKDLKGMGYKNMPAAIAFGVGALSMTGVPFFAGFSAKSYLGISALGSATGMLTYIAIILSSFLNALYYLPVLFSLFSRADSKPTNKLEVGAIKTPNLLMVSLVVFIAIHVFFGVGSNQIFGLLEKGFSSFAAPI